MTLRQRKRGGYHFALTCDVDTCKAEFTSGSGISGNTLRERAAEAGWMGDNHLNQDLCPVDVDRCKKAQAWAESQVKSS